MHKRVDTLERFDFGGPAQWAVGARRPNESGVAPDPGGAGPPHDSRCTGDRAAPRLGGSFRVAYWDQRGTGKSFNAKDRETMTLGPPRAALGDGPHLRLSGRLSGPARSGVIASARPTALEVAIGHWAPGGGKWPLRRLIERSLRLCVSSPRPRARRRAHGRRELRDGGPEVSPKRAHCLAQVGICVQFLAPVRTLAAFFGLEHVEGTDAVGRQRPPLRWRGIVRGAADLDRRALLLLWSRSGCYRRVMTVLALSR
jgi:hypothetical protein